MMRASSTVAVSGTILAMLLLSACSTTLQTTSGKDWLGAIPPSVQPQNSIDERVRDVANVEPILRFPARIGLARIASQYPRLSPIPTEEAAAWAVLADELGPDYGEFVPISPLIAAMVAAPHFSNERIDAMKELVDTIRLAAARQHLDAVVIYETDATANSKSNPLSIAEWTLIGAFVLPSQDIKAQGVAQAIIIDVRNGYHYGTIQATADDKTIAARFSNQEAERDLAKHVQTEAVKNLTKETRGLIRQLKVRLTALDKRS